MWIHLYFPRVLHLGVMCFTNLLPIPFICSKCCSLIFPSSEGLGSVSPCSASPGYWWVYWFPSCPFPGWRILTFMARLPSADLNCSISFPSPGWEHPFGGGSLTRTCHESMRVGCMVFRETQGCELSHSQSPPTPCGCLMCVFLASGTKQCFKLLSSKDTGSFLAFGRGVSHQVWICLFLNIFAHAMLNSSAPFLTIYTKLVDNNNN